jgi:hypothetical protein
MTGHSEKLSQAELRSIGEFLADAAGEFADHGCNDFSCASTPENKAVFTNIIEWQAGEGWGDPDPKYLDSLEKAYAENEEIVSFDNWAMGYFAQRCKALAQDASGSPGLSAAELRMMAALLDLVVESREMDRDDHDITVDYTLSATDENKLFLASVIKHEGLADSERMVADVRQSDDEIAVPDYWIMRYFSDRCKKLGAE